jgi:protein-tyrosine kinase
MEGSSRGLEPKAGSKRRSLVERAAGKLNEPAGLQPIAGSTDAATVATPPVGASSAPQFRPTQPDGTSAPTTPPRAAPAWPRAAEASPRPAAAEASPRPAAAEAASRPAAAEASRPAAAEAVTPDRPTSRFISLDFDRLNDAGILTPNTLRSRATEEFRLIKRGVLAKRWQEERPNSNLILVTSAVPSEGKTFVSLNLAMSIAFERDLRVLLIDADLSRPSIPKVLGIEVDRGMVDVLTGNVSDMSEVMLRTNIDGFSFLPSGRQHHLSTELLASQRMASFVEEIAQRYADRIVIFDSPPVLATSEPTALAQHVGQIVFVVRAEETSRTAVKTAMEILGTYSKKTELVLNAAKPQFGAASFGYYHYKGYYYQNQTAETG